MNNYFNQGTSPLKVISSCVYVWVEEQPYNPVHILQKLKLAPFVALPLLLRLCYSVRTQQRATIIKYL